MTSQVDKSRISTRFPAFTKPMFVGDFSTDFRTQRILPGRSRIRYFQEDCVDKEVSLDLDQGYSQYQPKPEVDERLDGLLKYILSISEPESTLRKVVHDADFVSWRGTLTRIACAPFEPSNESGWRILCALKGDVVFLCEVSTEAKLRKKSQESLKQKHMMFWGYKFEQYVTKEEKQGEPKISSPVSTWTNYSALFTLDLGNRREGSHVRIFAGAEIDCIDEKGEFIELKTQFKQLGLGRFWAQKAMKWWLQSFLVGIDKIMVGLRDDTGVVHQVQQVKVNDLGRRPTEWDPAVCLNFLLHFLHQTRPHLQETGYCIAEFNPSTANLTFTSSTSQESNFLIPEFMEQFNL